MHHKVCKKKIMANLCGLYKINSRTSIQQVWAMVRKLAGKYHSGSGNISHLEVNNNKITDIQDISNELAHTFSNNSSSHNYSARFQSFRSQTETQHLRFKSTDSFSYNNPFSIEELKLTDAISKARTQLLVQMTFITRCSNTCPMRLCKCFLGLSMTSATLVIFPTAGIRPLSFLF